MKVFGTGIHLDPWKSGLFFRGGDICDPLNGQWFGPTWPTRIWRAYCALPVLPFLSLKIGKYGAYMGFKLYGVHHEEYKNWMPAHEIFGGSMALCLSFRMTNSGGV